MSAGLSHGAWSSGVTRRWQEIPARPGWAKCGTDGGYYRHRRTVGEEACEDCKAAHAAAERGRYRKAS